MDPLVVLLRSLQATANNQGSGAPMTWKALSSATQDSGAPSIDYAGFNARWAQEETLPPEEQILHNLVDRFDNQGLVIKTNTQEPGMASPGQEQVKSKISQMAKRANSLA